MAGNAKVTQLILALLMGQLLFAVGTQPQDALPSNTAATVPQSTNAANTSSIDDYLAQKQRQYAALIEKMEMQFSAYKSRYDLVFATLNLQRDALAAKFEDLHNKLYTLEFSNELGRTCVQQYRPDITTPEDAKRRVDECTNNMLNDYKSDISGLGFNLDAVRNEYTIFFVSGIAKCRNNHLNPSDNYTSCIMNQISMSESYTTIFIFKFNEKVSDLSKCWFEERLRNISSCVFRFVHESLLTAGENMHAIENCSSAQGMCPCQAGQVRTQLSQRCMHQLMVNLKQSELREATISNPFIGHENIDCAEVNIIKG